MGIWSCSNGLGMDVYADCCRWLVLDVEGTTFVDEVVASPESPWKPDLNMVTRLVMDPSEFCLTPEDAATSSAGLSESEDLARLGRMESQASRSSESESERFRLQAVQPALTSGELSLFCPSTIRSLSGEGSVGSLTAGQVGSASCFSSRDWSGEVSVEVGWQFSLSSSIGCCCKQG
jgi:hypothetical protein